MEDHYFDPDDGFLRLQEVLELIPVSRTSWYAGIQKGIFPRPVPLMGSRAKGYRIKDIKNLLASMPEEGRRP